MRLAEQPVGSWVGVCRHMESSDKWSVVPAESCSLGGSSSSLPLPLGQPWACTKLKLWQQIPRGLPWGVHKILFRFNLIHIFLNYKSQHYGNLHSEKLLERNEVMGDAQMSPTLSPVEAVRDNPEEMGELHPGMWHSLPGSRERLPELSGTTLCFPRKIDSFAAGRDEWEGCDSGNIKRRT